VASERAKLAVDGKKSGYSWLGVCGPREIVYFGLSQVWQARAIQVFLWQNAQ